MGIRVIEMVWKKPMQAYAMPLLEGVYLGFTAER